MATKIIRANCTLHVPGEGHKAFKIDGQGNVTDGKYVAKAVPPGTPVEIDGEEADALIARGVAEEVVPEAVVAALPSGDKGGKGAAA